MQTSTKLLVTLLQDIPIYCSEECKRFQVDDQLEKNYETAPSSEHLF